MPSFELHIEGVGEDGETVHGRTEIEASSEEEAVRSYLSDVEHVEYWDVSVERVERIG